MTDYFDRDGKPIPDDYYNTAKHGRKYKWGTEKRIGRTVVGDWTVSTVWLGLNHDYLTGVPVVFETMVFGEPYENELRRYTTEEDAMRGHLLVLDRLRTGRPPFADMEDDS